jgi:uncharacterized membrane protein HdeD (DUF308 family)
MAQHKTTKYHQDYIESSVQRIYDKSAPMLLCESILFACIGGAMLVNPMGILTIITFILGGALLVLGVYRTIAGFIASNDYGGGWLDVTFGLINILVGILFFIYPAGSIVGLLYIFIILFMAKAISALIFAINMVRARFGHYVFNLIMAIILVGIATILLFNPLAGALAVVMVVACMLLIYALTDLYMFIQVKRFKHHVIG